MRYMMKDGATFSADTPKELVEKMRTKSFTDSFDARAFMSQTANRSMLATGAHVRADTAENFIHDLLEAGLVTIADEAQGKLTDV